MKTLNRVLLSVLFVSTALLAAFAALSYYSLKASDQLLRQITLLKPGENLKEVEHRLGNQLLQTDDPDYMIDRGPLKDRAFCRGKKLYWFYVSSPPSRALAVYTDERDVIVFVTWQNL